MERTFVMIKPDGVQRGLVGLSIARLEQKGLKLVAARLEELPELRVMEQYREHIQKPFFSGLKRYIMSGPCMLTVFEGKGSVAVIRNLIGATNPADACPGSIRGDFGMDIGRNVIHASDSVESAKREIAIHFHKDSITEYTRGDEPVLYE